MKLGTQACLCSLYLVSLVAVVNGEFGCRGAQTGTTDNPIVDWFWISKLPKGLLNDNGVLGQKGSNYIYVDSAMGATDSPKYLTGFGEFSDPFMRTLHSSQAGFVVQTVTPGISTDRLTIDTEYPHNLAANEAALFRTQTVGSADYGFVVGCVIETVNNPKQFGCKFDLATSAAKVKPPLYGFKGRHIDQWVWDPVAYTLKFSVLDQVANPLQWTEDKTFFTFYPSFGLGEPYDMNYTNSNGLPTSDLYGIDAAAYPAATDAQDIVNKQYAFVADPSWEDSHPQVFHWQEQGGGHNRGSLAARFDECGTGPTVGTDETIRCGFWVTHSVPYTPVFNEGTYELLYPNSGFEKGQQYLCVSFNAKLNPPPLVPQPGSPAWAFPADVDDTLFTRILQSLAIRNSAPLSEASVDNTDKCFLGTLVKPENKFGINAIHLTLPNSNISVYETWRKTNAVTNALYNISTTRFWAFSKYENTLAGVGLDVYAEYCGGPSSSAGCVVQTWKGNKMNPTTCCTGAGDICSALGSNGARVNIAQNVRQVTGQMVKLRTPIAGLNQNSSMWLSDKDHSKWLIRDGTSFEVCSGDLNRAGGRYSYTGGNNGRGGGLLCISSQKVHDFLSGMVFQRGICGATDGIYSGISGSEVARSDFFFTEETDGNSETDSDTDTDSNSVDDGSDDSAAVGANERFRALLATDRRRHHHHHHHHNHHTNHQTPVLSPYTETQPLSDDAQRFLRDTASAQKRTATTAFSPVVSANKRRIVVVNRKRPFSSIEDQESDSDEATATSLAATTNSQPPKRNRLDPVNGARLDLEQLRRTYSSDDAARFYEAFGLDIPTTCGQSDVVMDENAVFG